MSKLRIIGCSLSLFLLGAGGAGCAALHAERHSSWQNFNEIASNPEFYDGKVVTIKGWVSMRNEDFVIWASRADYEGRNWKNCITLLNHFTDVSRNQLLDRSEVLVTGTFHKNIFVDREGRDVIRLGACNNLGIRFTEPDGLRSAN